MPGARPPVSSAHDKRTAAGLAKTAPSETMWFMRHTRRDYGQVRQTTSRGSRSEAEGSRVGGLDRDFAKNAGTIVRSAMHSLFRSS